MKKIFLVFCLMLSMFVISCGKGKKASGKSVSFNMEAEPTSLDPQILTDMSGLFITSMTYESLVRVLTLCFVHGADRDRDNRCGHLCVYLLFCSSLRTPPMAHPSRRPF